MANRCVLLWTGGRKSRLAAELLVRQQIEIELLHVAYPLGDDAEAERRGGRLGLPFRRVDAATSQFAAALGPKQPVARWSAPCVDCQAMQLTFAAEVARERGADFVATGDVAGGHPCRPPDRFDEVDAQAGLAGRVLRPLSALALPITRPEEDGLLDRTKLLRLTSGSRKALWQAGRALGVDPGDEEGATCRYAERAFGERFAHARSELRDALSLADLGWLALGRHYLSGRSRIVVPESPDDDERLRTLARDGDWVVVPAEVESPSVLVRGETTDEDLRAAAILLARASGARRAVPAVEIVATCRGGGERRSFRVKPGEPRPPGLVRL